MVFAVSKETRGRAHMQIIFADLIRLSICFYVYIVKTFRLTYGSGPVHSYALATRILKTNRGHT